MDHIQLLQRLKDLSDEDYRTFSAHLLPPGTSLLGVRLPQLRIIAKEIAGTDWENFLSADPMSDYMEETMVCGFVIGYAKMPLEERLEYIRKYVPAIANWSVCDSFCSTFRFHKDELPQMRIFLNDYLSSEKEYEARLGFVMLLDHFLSQEWLSAIFTACNGCRTSAFYTQMSIAWLLSSCFIHYPDETMPFLADNRLSDFTQNMTIRKICDSFRVSDARKAVIRRLKRISPNRLSENRL